MGSLTRRMALLALTVDAAEALAQSARDEVLSLIMLGGLERRLVSLSGRFMRQLRAGVTPNDLSANGGRLERQLSQSLAPLALVQQVAQALDQRLTPTDVRVLSGFLGGGVGKRIVAAEVDGERLWDDEAALRKEGALVWERMPQERRAEIQEIVAAKREGVLLAALGTNVGIASVRHLSKVSASEMQRNERELLQRQQHLEERFTALSVWRHALMLRELASGDLRIGAGMYSSVEGRRYTSGFYAGCQAAILTAIKQLSAIPKAAKR